MAVLFAKDASSQSAGITTVNAAETLVLVGAALTVPNATGKALIKAWCTYTVPTSATAVTLRIYRGTSASGTLIGAGIAQAGNFTAGNPAAFSFQVTDALSGVGTAQYCMTIQATAGSVSSTVTFAVLETEVLSG